MKGIKFALLGLAFSASATVFAALPDNYQSLSSDEKQVILWEKVTNSHQENPLPEVDTGGFSKAYKLLTGLFNLSPSFDHESDQLPKGREKILHPNGSVAKVSFVPSAGHPFTGIYQSGAIGIARLSLAQAASDDSYIPGMAVKFLLPSGPSLNLHLINSLEGQGADWNFFEKTLSNKIAHPDGWLLKAIEGIFEWTRSPANDLPVAHLAEMDDSATIVKDPISPEQIFFQPSERVHHLIAEDSREDFRLSLLKIQPGALYDVYGLFQGESFHIGTLMLESELLASDYGDKELFFQHRR
jgi:hypothetical protein